MNKTLQEKIEILEQQRDQHAALMNQAIGAISLARHLMEKDHLSLDELGDALGGKVEDIEEINGNQD